MSGETNNRCGQENWTRGRTIRAGARLVLFLVLAAVSYHVGGFVPVATAATSESANAPLPAAPPAPTIVSAPASPLTTAPLARAELPPPVTVAPLNDINGGSFKLADFFGKVMVVNLWATWCGPCRTEIPELVKVHKEFGSRGVELIGLTSENPDASAEKVRKFIQDFQIGYRIGWAPPEVAAALMQEHVAIPQTFVISRDGFVVKRFVGFNPANTAGELKQALEEALK